VSVDYLNTDHSIETKWRSLILFGNNTATYKFAFAKSLLELVDNETTKISLEDLAKPFALNLAEHLKSSPKQINSNTSSYLNEIARFYKGEIISVNLTDEKWEELRKKIKRFFYLIRLRPIPKPKSRPARCQGEGFWRLDRCA
jgi:hypothetical protein